jgi:hypothetical protein
VRFFRGFGDQGSVSKTSNFDGFLTLLEIELFYLSKNDVFSCPSQPTAIPANATAH